MSQSDLVEGILRDYGLPIKNRFGQFQVGGPIQAGDISRAAQQDPAINLFSEVASDLIPGVREERAISRIKENARKATEAERPITSILRGADATADVAGIMADYMPAAKAAAMALPFMSGVIKRVAKVPKIKGGRFFRGSPNKGAATFSGAPTGPTDTGKMFVGSQETAELYGRGGKIYTADVEPGRYIDGSTKAGSDLIQEFKAETGLNPYLRGTDRGSQINWTMQTDFEDWLDAKGVDYDGVFYAENNNTSSLALNNRGKVKLTEGVPIEDWAESVKKKHGLEDFDVFESKDDIKLNMINVSKEARKQGKGSAAMEELIERADQENKRIILSVGQKDDVFGTTSRSRLVKFYKRHGFVENKGRNKDFAISEGMYREPQN